MNIPHPAPTTPLRERLISNMSERNFGPALQTSHLRACKRFAAWSGRSPETTMPDDVKYFQQHLIESGTSICTRNQTMTGVKFLFSNRMKRDLAIRALDMAVALRKPPKDCIHHTDTRRSVVLLVHPSCKMLGETGVPDDERVC